MWGWDIVVTWLVLHMIDPLSWTAGPTPLGIRGAERACWGVSYDDLTIGVRGHNFLVWGQMWWFLCLSGCVWVSVCVCVRLWRCEHFFVSRITKNPLRIHPPKFMEGYPWSKTCVSKVDGYRGQRSKVRGQLKQKYTEVYNFWWKNLLNLKVVWVDGI